MVNLQHIRRLRILCYLRNRPRRRIYRERLDPLVHFDNTSFLNRFRFTKVFVLWLAQQLEQKLKPVDSRGKSLSTIQQILVALRFYATGCFHVVSGDLMRVSTSTACRCVKNVSVAVASLKNHYISMPTNRELPQIAAEFKRLSSDNLVGVIGAIDCTHIRMKLPAKRVAGRYYNRKQYYSLNVQIVGDAQLRIRNIVCRWPGSVHDSRIYENSLLKESLDRGQMKGHLIGDGGYAATEKMLVPYRNPSTPQQVRYNNAQIRARNSVERLFGVLKSRFPCLGQILRLKVATSQAVIVACCVLHNLAIHHNQQQFPPGQHIPRILNGDQPLPNNAAGAMYRDRYVEQFFN